MEKNKISVVAIYFIIGLLVIIALINIYMAWKEATYKMSAQIDCNVEKIDYVYLTDENGTGNCMFPLVSGNVTVCALPKDFHCKGLIQDFPLFRAILETE
jgi:hypothetical protein